MKILLSIIMLLFLTLNGYTEEVIEKTNKLDLSKISISPKVLASFPMLRFAPYNSSDIINEKKGIDKKIKEREIKYSMYWITETLRNDFRPRKEKANFYFISGLGKSKDDALVVNWEYEDYKFEVIDSRLLTLLIKKENLKASNVFDMFKDIIYYNNNCYGIKTKVIIQENYKISQKKSYGKIFVDRGIATGWYVSPIEWYQDDDMVLFIFEKIFKPPLSKNNTPIVDYGDPTKLIGGIPPEDPRSFLRLHNSNRVELLKEYHSKEYKKRFSIKRKTNNFIDTNKYIWGQNW